MTVHITNTRGWTKVDGRIAKPSFTLEKLRWHGEGEDVYLVGCDSSSKKCDGTPGVDCINWDNAPEWALEELAKAGVSLEEKPMPVSKKASPKPKQEPQPTEMTEVDTDNDDTEDA